MLWGKWDMRRYLQSSELQLGCLHHAYRNIACSSELAQSIMDLNTSILVPFPQFDGSKFRRLMDREMGFEL